MATKYESAEYNTEPSICKLCRTRSCTRSPVGSVDVCEWGVAYYNHGDYLQKKQTLVPLRYLSQNLRHEINRVLSVIVKELNSLNPRLTVRAPDINDPTGRILGATLVIDHFLQMVAGVHEFHPTRSLGVSSRKETVFEMANRYFQVYSLIQNEKRATNLEFQAQNCGNVTITLAPECIDYIFAVLVDNAWKYSENGTAVLVTTEEVSDGYCDISFQNVSNPIPDSLNVFDKGTQAVSDSEGFGFGLFWASSLVAYYNEIRGDAYPQTELCHSQRIIGDNVALQEFVLLNVVCNVADK